MESREPVPQTFPWRGAFPSRRGTVSRDLQPPTNLGYPPSVSRQCLIHSRSLGTNLSVRNPSGAPTAETIVDRVAPSPSAAVGGRNRTRYHAEPMRPPSHTIRSMNKRGRTRSIAIRTRARMPPAYRRISGGAAIAVEIHSTNGISRAAMTRNPRRHFHRISVDHLTVGNPPAETPDPL